MASSLSGVTPKSPESTSWSTSDQSTSGNPGNGSPTEVRSPGFSTAGFLRGFPPPMQKKVTRDGQPAKRRGPKPDSKPAQTRRQELNRQAQRTHRERKEHYIKALESEVARLRDTFVEESTRVQTVLKNQSMMLQGQQMENYILKEMLAARGIPFDAELQHRKQTLMMSPQKPRGASPSAFAPPQTSVFNTQLVQPTSITQPLRLTHESSFTNGGSAGASRHSPGAQHQHQHHSSSPVPDIPDFSTGKDRLISDKPGVFERDPQLGIDFILALEETCRDHTEYLVRRSMNSPNEPEEALFSGHALMASCPPPNHIATTPAQQGGLQPTYPHQTPQISIEALNTLLNLSRVIKSEGYVEGGQVTPIMALQSLRGHYGYQSLTRDDVIGMIDSIRNKVRCYGFGAVMEDFELRDALTSIFATKPEAYEGIDNVNISDEVDKMYS